MLDYSFLVMSVILAIPGLFVWVFRTDLRVVIRRMVIASMPFALTERLFYPEYWKPRFLWDLVDVIGFGVEDVLFVAGLAAFASTAWALVARQKLVEVADSLHGVRTGGLLLVGTFVCVAFAALLDIPMIYAAPVIMVVVSGGICAQRHDLVVPALGGASVTLVVYTLVCLALDLCIPGVFDLDWNTDKFLNIFVLGVPVEELLYAWTSGLIATVFYPFVFRARFVSIKALEAKA